MGAVQSANVLCNVLDVRRRGRTILIEGVNWINDKLLSFCSWFHNYFVAPFLSDEENNGFPIRILEAYDIDKVHELLEQGRLR